MGAFYSVEHETRYTYASSVSTSWHVAYLYPRVMPRQRVPWHELAVDPRPARSSRRVDYFGNTVDQFTMLGPHTVLRACGRSLVEVFPARTAIDPGLSPPWEEVRDALTYVTGTRPSEATQYAYPSPYVTLDPELDEFARASFPRGRPLLAGAIDLMHRIHAEFQFDPSATTITTPVSRVLVERRGVCQDFAHLQISCLRGLGLTARYVSGYILTTPPPGRPRLIGADASHAWLSVHCPRHGWVDLDPTNDLLPDVSHVTLAWGRDYGDVSPLRGVILGSAQHTLHVGVSVMPLDSPEWEDALGAMGGRSAIAR
ncbi:MAG TPA: transglutaminase family protein [Candidatus Methylomirabilis sp.]|nr:transglutaminase family protein [Candidatus Methylomirabilis sp.]